MNPTSHTSAAPGEFSYYLLDGPDVWGDFGTTLIGGTYERDADGRLLVYRTGPFVPPVALPGLGVMVVDDQFRRTLENSPLTGLTFAPAVRHRIVEFHWEHWDRAVEVGPLPRLNEPEDLLFNFPHSERAAEAMGPLWEARVERLVEARSVNVREPWDYDLMISSPLEAVNERDFFGAKNRDRIFVSERAKEWLESHVPQWVSLKPVLKGDG